MFKLPKFSSIPLKKKKTLKEDSGLDKVKGITQKPQLVQTNVEIAPNTKKEGLLKFDASPII